MGDRHERRERGAFFTPSAIADYLAFWAVRGNPNATVLDPTCGGGVFLEAAGRRLLEAGADADRLPAQLYGIDLHEATVEQTTAMLAAQGMGASIIANDFFATPAPGEPRARIPQVDAVLGNPPFVRFHQHVGENRRLSAQAALRQGVKLPSNSSSWAASLVHASAFVKPTGTLAWVVPAELLTVAYAEPIRQWLRRRFAFVRLVFFEKLQFSGASEQVVLLIASGTGGCESFSLVYAEDGSDLETLHALDVGSGVPSAAGKWTDMLLTMHERGLLRRVQTEQFVPLSTYGKVVLGTVTGANNFFCMSDATRQGHGLRPDIDVIRTVPAGANKLTSYLAFSAQCWEDARESGDRVWMLNPDADPEVPQVKSFLEGGKGAAIHEGYKCRKRTVWWRIPVVAPPDLFFTYMSHMKPRLVANDAGVTFLNSLHGVKLHEGMSKDVVNKLAVSSMNSVTMLSAETSGRAYGGGVLKLEPTEAAALPVLSTSAAERAWATLKGDYDEIGRWLRAGEVEKARERVDQRLLGPVLGLNESEASAIRAATDRLRTRRMGTRRA